MKNSTSFFRSIAFAVLDASQIDSTEQERELLRCNLSLLRTCIFADKIGWKLKRSLFESLVPNGQSISVPVQDLQPVTISIAENKQLAAQRILLNDRCDHARETIERAAHVCRLRAQKDLEAGLDPDHASAP
nr:hypothetical protein [Stieleria maiorica]